MAEPLAQLLRRTRGALETASSRALMAHNAPLAAQLQDRADQCAAWMSQLSQGDVTDERDAEIREACAEYLRLCGGSRG